MNFRTCVAIQLLLLLAVMIATAVTVSSLPAVVPVHWGIDGKPDRYGSPWETAIVGVFVVGMPIAITLATPWLKKIPSARPFSPDGTYYSLMVGISFFTALLYLGILRMTVSNEAMAVNLIFGAMFALFLFIGIQMPKMKPNPVMGVKTPWTLADPRVWEATHRRAGALWVWGSVIGLALSWIPNSFGFMILLLIVLSFAPIVDSYLIAKRYRQSGL